jgi:hypothetical protein
MLGVILLSIFVGAALIVLFLTRNGTRNTPSQKTETPTMLFAPGSADEAGRAYHPGRKDGAMPFPLGKKKERKRTETYRIHSDD